MASSDSGRDEASAVVNIVNSVFRPRLQCYRYINTTSFDLKDIIVNLKHMNTDQYLNSYYCIQDSEYVMGVMNPGNSHPTSKPLTTLCITIFNIHSFQRYRIQRCQGDNYICGLFYSSGTSSPHNRVCYKAMRRWNTKSRFTVVRLRGSKSSAGRSLKGLPYNLSLMYVLF